MNSMRMAVAAAVFLAGTMTGGAMANDRGVNGLLLGAGSGALVGQAIGRDTEGTLIGTAVGGMLGYMVGNEMDKGYGHPYPPPQPVVYGPPPPPPAVVYVPPPPPAVVYVPPPPRPRPVVYAPPPRPWRHHGHPPDQVCRQIVERRDHHGRYREVVTTVCRDRNDWGYDRRRDWRHDYDRRW